MPRDIEAKRQVILVAIELGVEKLRQHVRDWDDEAVQNIYDVLDGDYPTTTRIELKMPTGKDLL